MSYSYSANQYENAYKAQRLQNWTVPKQFKERPSTAEGQTTFIANDRGHLLPGVKTPPPSVSQAGERHGNLPPSGPDRPNSQTERPASQAVERPASQEPERAK